MFVLPGESRMCPWSWKDNENITREQLKHAMPPRASPSSIFQFPPLSLIRVRDIIWVWISFLFDYDVHGGCYLDTQVSSVRGSHDLLGIQIFARNFKRKILSFLKKTPSRLLISVVTYFCRMLTL